MCGGCFSRAWVNVERLPVSGPAGSLVICTEGVACQELRIGAGADDLDSVPLELGKNMTAHDMGDREVTATLRIGEVVRTSSTRLTFVAGEGECGCDRSWGVLEW
jgi:hypothetical protein